MFLVYCYSQPACQVRYPSILGGYFIFCSSLLTYSLGQLPRTRPPQLSRFSQLTWLSQLAKLSQLTRLPQLAWLYQPTWLFQLVQLPQIPYLSQLAFASLFGFLKSVQRLLQLLISYVRVFRVSILFSDWDFYPIFFFTRVAHLLAYITRGLVCGAN